MHYAITDKILQLFPMHDGARLRFGAVLPDASVNKRKTHFRVYNEKLGIRLYDLESYRAQFGERMQKDELLLGFGALGPRDERHQVRQRDQHQNPDDDQHHQQLR